MLDHQFKRILFIDCTCEFHRVRWNDRPFFHSKNTNFISCNNSFLFSCKMHRPQFFTVRPLLRNKFYTNTIRFQIIDWKIRSLFNVSQDKAKMPAVTRNDGFIVLGHPLFYYSFLTYVADFLLKFFYRSNSTAIKYQLYECVMYIWDFLHVSPIDRCHYLLCAHFVNKPCVP